MELDNCSSGEFICGNYLADLLDNFTLIFLVWGGRWLVALVLLLTDKIASNPVEFGELK